MLTIYYDSQCPLCSREMQHLKSFDHNNLIQLADLHQDNFAQKYPHIDQTEAMEFLHGEYQGELLLGLDVTYRAWNLVNKPHYVCFLKWPLVNRVAQKAYKQFARHRHTLSRILVGKPSCQKCR